VQRNPTILVQETLRHRADGSPDDGICLRFVERLETRRADVNPPCRQSTSNTRFPDSASHRLDNLQFVGIDDLDLRLAAHESRDANVRQRRSELDVIRPNFRPAHHSSTA
jgi:hypothetical protein